MSTLAIHDVKVWGLDIFKRRFNDFLKKSSTPLHDIKVWGGRFILLLITLRGASKVLFSIRKSHLIGPPPILLEHGADSPT